MFEVEKYLSLFKKMLFIPLVKNYEIHLEFSVSKKEIFVNLTDGYNVYVVDFFEKKPAHAIKCVRNLLTTIKAIEQDITSMIEDGELHSYKNAQEFSDYYRILDHYDKEDEQLSDEIINVLVLVAFYKLIN